MSCPKTKNGFTRIADELLDALVRFDLSKRQYKIVLAVIRKTYGYNKKADDMSSRQLALLTGIADTHCRSAVRELAKMQVLLVNPGKFGQVIGLNKDYEAWHADYTSKPRTKTVRTKTVRKEDQNGPQGGPKQSGHPDQNGPPPRTKTVLNNRQLPIDNSNRHTHTPPPRVPGIDARAEISGGGGESGQVISAVFRWPPALSTSQRKEAAGILKQCPVALHQQVLDELGAYMAAGAVRTTPVRLLAGIVKKAAKGEFTAGSSSAAVQFGKPCPADAVRLSAIERFGFDPEATTTGDPLNVGFIDHH